MSMSLGDASQRGSKSSIALAVVLILLGILAVALPYVTSFGIVRVLAWLIIFDGLTQLVQAFRAEGGGRAIWKFLVALLYIAGGIYLLVYPTLGLIGLSFAMAVFFFAEGVMELANYISTRASNGSQWMLLHAIASLLLGLVIWRRWPISSLWAVGMLVGIGMIMTGVTRLMMALAVRRAQPA
jgi:uncharacterized membrane protein HdeD (DUF308 family)